jgi:nitrous oxide reductase accessory protein NosL
VAVLWSKRRTANRLMERYGGRIVKVCRDYRAW